MAGIGQMKEAISGTTSRCLGLVVATLRKEELGHVKFEPNVTRLAKRRYNYKNIINKTIVNDILTYKKTC